MISDNAIRIWKYLFILIGFITLCLVCAWVNSPTTWTIRLEMDNNTLKAVESLNQTTKNIAEAQDLSKCQNNTYYNYWEQKPDRYCENTSSWWEGNYENRTMRKCWIYQCGNVTNNADCRSYHTKEANWIECKGVR